MANKIPNTIEEEIALRQTAETALGKAEEIFRLLVDAVEDYAIFALDTKGRILTWNKGAERLKGYKAHEIIGQHFSKFYTQSDIDRNHPQEELEFATINGKFEEESWRVRKDGQIFWANVVITKLTDHQKNHIGFAKVTRDLTERKMAEDAEEENKDRTRLMTEVVKDYAIFLLDPNGNVATWNEGARRIKQYEASEIIGKHFSTFYPQEDLDNKKPEMEIIEVMKHGRYEDEGWRVKKDGSRFWANVIITALYDKRGHHIGFSKITRDLTERKENEEKLRVMNDELEKKVAARTKELNAALKARESFLSIASHELKTPLTSLKLQTQMRVRSFSKNPEALHQASELSALFNNDEKQINRLTRLVDDILDTTRIDAGKLGLQLEEVNLCELISALLKNLSPQLQHANCEIQFRCTGLVKGLWDAYRLEQVFTNLMTNAMRYGQGSPIEVTVETKEKNAFFTVRDHGIGIPAKDRERIFQQFERATNLNEGKGLGLGLYIVRQIVESHGGTITLKSSQGKGSEFRVELPL